MNEHMALIAVASIISAGFCVGVGVLGPSLAEGQACKQAIESMANQPDEANNIRSNLFVQLAFLETGAIYSLLIAMIVIFANPFWNYAVAMAAK